MILYEFICGECRHEFEELVSPQDPDENLVCPKCGSHDIQRLVSAVRSQRAGGGTGFPSGGGCAPSAGFS